MYFIVDRYLKKVHICKLLADVSRTAFFPTGIDASLTPQAADRERRLSCLPSRYGLASSRSTNPRVERGRLFLIPVGVIEKAINVILFMNLWIYF